MRKKKILAMILVAMLSLSGLTGCSDKDKADISNKLNNKTTETTKKDDSKPADKTSESKSDNKSDNKKSDSTSKPSGDKKSDSASTGSTSSNKKPGSSSQNSNAGSASKPDNSTASKPSHSNNGSAPSKPAETKPSKPAHQHTWVDHTATKQVSRTVHHDAVYETVTIPAVTKWQVQCMGCGQWFDSLDDIAYHAFTSPVNEGCGRTATGETREVVITPAHTEQKLVKDAWDETVYDTQTYVDYQYCSGCGQHK